MFAVTLQRWLDVELPVIQAPMAGVQGSALAIAASDAGGLGFLPCAMLAPEAINEELVAITSQTKRPYGVGFFCHEPPHPDPARERAWRSVLAPYYEEFGIDPATIPAGAGRLPFTAQAADVVERFRPAVVSFHFGLPARDLLDRVRSWGSRIVSSATTVEEARWLEAHGVDAIIAQGVEAGGHRGMFLTDAVTTQLGTLALLPQVLRAVNVPVIAAGGIADAKSVSAMLSLGAAAVQVGTAFLLCPESTTSKVHRAALASEGASHTALTNLFTGRAARGIVNRIMRELGPMSAAPPPFPLATSAIAPLRSRAEARGVGDFSPLWCGQNASGCRDIAAGRLLRELAGVGD